MTIIKSILTFIFLLFLTTDSFCQDESEGLVQFNDTIEFYKPKIDTVVSLDSIFSLDFSSKKGKVTIIDTLTNFNGFLVMSITAPYQFKHLIALKRGNIFIVFPVLDEGSYGEITARKISFGNSNILLIKFIQSDGLSWDTHGWGDYTHGFEVWDLDKIERLANFVNYHSHLQWETEDESQSKYNFCQNYSYVIEKQTIIFTRQSNCSDHDEGLKRTIKIPEIIKYSLTSNGLIKNK